MLVARRLACIAAFGALVARSADARACSANETQVYQSASTTWCVDQGVVQKYGPLPSAYFAYGDQVIAELVAVFNVPAQGNYTFEAGPVTGGAHTGSECCGLGVTVTGDAFYGDAYGVTGFWGYLLSLHESINDWTGQVSGGWPTDFWADHISAYPNSIDWQIMAALGAKLNDANLTKAATAQKGRFYPGGDSVDPRVPMFDSIFAMPGMGFDGWSHVFSYVQRDGVSWDGLGVPNPDELRTEYVAAYVSLGPRLSVLPTFASANVGNGTDDGAGQGDKTYVAQEPVVDAIATAHCSIAAAEAQGVDVSADRDALRGGHYASVAAKGKCGAGCPAECGCKSSTGLCVAPWLGDAPPSDAGAGAIPDAGGGDGATSGGQGSLDAGLPVPTPSGAPNGAAPGGSTADGGSGSSSGCACGLAPGREDRWALAIAGVLAALVAARARRR